MLGKPLLVDLVLFFRFFFKFVSNSIDDLFALVGVGWDTLVIVLGVVGTLKHFEPLRCWGGLLLQGKLLGCELLLLFLLLGHNLCFSLFHDSLFVHKLPD